MQRECPYCAEKIQRRAKICRFCSAKVDPLYVENPVANKQICKVMAWHSDGNDSATIANLMNESGELTLDSQEQWTSDRIQTIVSSFSRDEIKNTTGSTKGEQQTDQPESHVGKKWYWTKWVWVWLIIFWPVGVYGLVQRAPSEHQKWWWIGLGILVLFIIVNGAGGSNSKVSQSPYDQFKSSNDPTDELVKRCASKAGIPANKPNHAITPAEMQALTSCVDRYMQ